jgi:putative membrane protein
MPEHGGVMGFGGFFGLLFWLILIIVTVSLLKWLLSRQNNKPDEWSAMDILNKRFAAGDITEEEYLRMKKRIEEKE